MGEWKEYKISELLKIKYGKDHKKLADGNIPLYGSGGIMRYVDSFLYDKESILIPRKGTLTNLFYLDEPFWTVDTLFWSKINTEIVFGKFLFYYLKTINFTNLNVGSAVPSLTTKVINTIDILLPPLKEQKAIAKVLSSLDDKIYLLYRQNKTLEELAQTLFRQWFIEEAKEGWEDVELGSVIETTSGGTPSRKNMTYYDDGKYAWVKSKELHGSFLIDTEEKITEEALQQSSAKLLPENSILIAMYGATVGEYAIISKQMTCNQAICALKPNENYPYTFLYMYVKNYKDEIINMAIGSAQQNISQLLIKQLPICSDIKLISKFHAEVEPLFQKIKSNIKQVKTLKNMRDTLLPKLMSGEVRVKL